jgi:hypothetical protein
VVAFIPVIMKKYLANSEVEKEMYTCTQYFEIEM